MRQHFQLVGSYLDEGDIKQARKYLENMTGRLNLRGKGLLRQKQIKCIMDLGRLILRTLSTAIMGIMNIG